MPTAWHPLPVVAAWERHSVVEWRRGLIAVRQGADGVDLELTDGERLRTGWLVGCDGAHSTVRKATSIDFPGVPLAERFLIADVHADLPCPRDAVSVWVRGSDMVAAFPLPGRDLWRLMTPHRQG